MCTYTVCYYICFKLIISLYQDIEKKHAIFRTGSNLRFTKDISNIYLITFILLGFKILLLTEKKLIEKNPSINIILHE